MIACNYGVRNFQVSDIDEKTSFASYQLNRWICGALALGCGLMYSSARGYDAQMATIGLGVYLYKVIDGVARRVRRPPAAGRQTLLGWNEPNATLRRRHRGLQRGAVPHAQHAHRGHGHGCHRDRLARAGHRAGSPCSRPKNRAA